MDDALKRPGYNINDTDRLNFKVLTASLVWYANLQDDPANDQLNSLVTLFNKDYQALSTSFNSILGKLFKYETILSDDIDAVKEKIKGLKDVAKMTALRNVLTPYWDLITAKKQAEQELDACKKKNEVWQSNLNIAVNQLNILNEKKTLMNASGVPLENFATDSIQKKKSIDSLNQLINTQNCVVVEKRSEDLKQKVIQKKSELITEFQVKTDNINLLAALSEISDINTYEKWSKTTSPVIETEKIAEQIVQFKEIIHEANATKALNFKLPTEAEMIDAIAIYLAKRVKQEAVMWFFESIKKDAKNYALIKSFFPNTITLLQSNEVYEIPNLGSQWRYELSKDFIKMPKNILESPWFRRLTNDLNLSGSNQQIKKMLLTAYDVADLMSKKYNYYQIVKHMYLNNVDRGDTLAASFGPGNIFSVLYAFNQECYEYKEGSNKEIRLLRYEDFNRFSLTELEIMLSLLDMKYAQSFQKLWRVNGADKRFLSKANVEAFRKWAGNIEMGIQQFDKISMSYNQAQQDSENGKKTDVVYSVFNIWEHLNQMMVMVMQIPEPGNDNVKKIVSNSIQLKERLRKGFEVYNQLSLKNYAGAVSTTISLVEDFFYNQGTVVLSWAKVEQYMKDQHIHYNEKLVHEYLSLNKISTGSDSFFLKQNSILTSILFEEDRQALKIVRRLSGFLNDVMLVKGDAKALSKVVESYAVPPGSYKRKRNSWSSIDLNAYVGGYYGTEWLDGGSARSGNVFGITAPIGISFNKTFGKKMEATDSLSEDLIRNPGKLKIRKGKIRKRSNSTFTIDLSVVDLGAVVSYRFNHIAEEGLPKKVKWTQLLSPGLRVGYGLPNTPLIIGMGYQFTPELRSLTADSKDLYSAHRVSVNLMFDLPLFHIWESRPKVR
jgi:hypothetical protein